MLSDAEIKEIEDQIYTHSMPTGTIVTKILVLIATVKEQRELLNHATEYMRHAPVCSNRAQVHFCDCGLVELQKQIEEKVK